MAHFEIITAHAYSAKSKQYIVGAYVKETLHDGLPGRDTFKVLFNYAIMQLTKTKRSHAKRQLTGFYATMLDILRTCRF